MTIELVDSIPKLEQTYREVVTIAIGKSIITEEEWNNRFKNYRDEYGYSFIHYLECIICNIDVFITLNPIMLGNRKELKARFGVEILTPEKAIKTLN